VQRDPHRPVLDRFVCGELLLADYDTTVEKLDHEEADRLQCGEQIRARVVGPEDSEADERARAEARAISIK
jgi:hypothetical protein